MLETHIFSKVPEVIKYQAENGCLFDEEWKAKNYEIAMRMIKGLGDVIGISYSPASNPMTSLLKEIFIKRKKIKDYLSKMEEFDGRIINDIPPKYS